MGLTQRGKSLKTQNARRHKAPGAIIQFIFHFNRGEPLLENIEFDALLADKAFDADWIISILNERGTKAVISLKISSANSKNSNAQSCKVTRPAKASLR